MKKEENSEKKSNNSRTTHLPKLTIKPFSGNVLEWMTFFDSYKVAIHQSNLSDIEKFNYLRGFLTDDALKTIEGLTLSSENYEKAISVLEERYGNKDIIIAKHMKELIDLKPIQSDEDTRALRKFYDTLEVHVRSLMSLNIDKLRSATETNTDRKTPNTDKTCFN